MQVTMSAKALLVVTIIYILTALLPTPTTVPMYMIRLGKHRWNFSFVSVPKSQRTPEQISRSLLILTSWLRFENVRVVLACSEQYFDPTRAILPKIRVEYGDRIYCTGNLATGYQGRPLIREWFLVGMRNVTSDFLVFLNSDIFVTPEFMRIIPCVFDAFPVPQQSKVVLFGGRVNLNHSDHGLRVLWDSGNATGFETRFSSYVRSNYHSNLRFGLDAIVVQSRFNGLDLSRLPDFVVGMCAWDNFFMAWANSQCLTVTTQFVVPVYHINHGMHACTHNNTKYFMNMARRSKSFRGFQAIEHSRWSLSKNERFLLPRHKTDSLIPVSSC